MYTPKDWGEFQIQAVINLYRHNLERGMFTGPLDSLTGDHIMYLKEEGIMQFYKDDFYTWLDKDSVAKWRTLKNVTLKELSEGKAYQMNNADIIETAIYGKKRFTKRYYGSFEEIAKIVPTEKERRKIYPAYKAFDAMLENFYKTNGIDFTS